MVWRALKESQKKQKETRQHPGLSGLSGLRAIIAAAAVRGCNETPLQRESTESPQNHRLERVRSACAVGFTGQLGAYMD